MEFSELIHAVQTLNAPDAFRPRLSPDHWRHVTPFFTRHEIRAGDLLIDQAVPDRAMYLLGRGSLQVFVPGAPPGSRISILRPGAVTGEAALFGDGGRMAHVEAVTPCIVWALSSARFEEMAMRLPQQALEVLRAAGAVLATRARLFAQERVPFA